MVTLYIFSLGIRSAVHLRVVDGIRYLIAMIQTVFKDMRYFMIVLMVSIVIFSTIQVELLKSLDHATLGSDAPPKLNLSTLFLKFDLTYGVGFGAWDANTSFTWHVYFYFLLETILFPLIMFNLLIAIISKTFEDCEENKDITDI